jgi:hypothetical protein
MKRSLVLSIFALLTIFLAATVPAYAQATRTWVSGVGDDANPCSRTAPCKTFAGAISKTAAGGEINVLDPGGFGGVTITKAITISSESFEAGVLVSGTNAIIVNVPNAADRVTLRGLDIEGLGTGLSGVTVIAGGNVTVENCTIHAFTISGINFVPTVAGSQLHVSNTVVRNNGAGSGTGVTGQGILVSPSGAGTATATLDHVRMDHNVAGFKAVGAVFASVSDTSSTNSGFAGYAATSGANLTLQGAVATNNNTTSTPSAGGVVCTSSTVFIGNTSMNHNLVAPVNTSGGGCTCKTYGNNNVDVAPIGAGCTVMAPE